MEKNKETLEDILNHMIAKAIAMNLATGSNEKLSDNIKIAQKATALVILEPAFEYMENIEDTDMKYVVEGYRNALDTLKNEGLIKKVKNEELKKFFK